MASGSPVSVWSDPGSPPVHGHYCLVQASSEREASEAKTVENHWSKYLVVGVMFMALGPVIFPLLLIATIISTLYGLGDE